MNGRLVEVLLALVRVYREQGRATVRKVADEVGCSISTALGDLVELRTRGFVAWTDGQRGTLRPLVEEVDPPCHKPSGEHRCFRYAGHPYGHICTCGANWRDSEVAS